jgi:formylglycine-generating enzyme required for sulfatase activity
MLRKSLAILISFVVITISGGFAIADCPSADVTGDCFVDFEDFAVMANQWRTTDPCVPDDMVYIPDGEFEMGDHLGDGFEDELPIHAVFLDAFFMSKYETTNQQYCDYLNDAYSLGQIKVVSGRVYASSDGSNSYPYCDTSSSSPYSQIDYNNVSGTFSVRTKGEPPRDMSDDPMVMVSWYGAAVYCNWRSQQEGKEQCYNLSTWTCDFSRHGYRLATEAEWEYAARSNEQSPYYRFPWGDTISHSQANYYSDSYFSYDVSPTRGYHPAYNDGIYPYTAPVGSLSANGYGLYDMSGNVGEWCNDWYNSIYYSTSPYDNPQGPASGTYRVLRGGCWYYFANFCRVAVRIDFTPDYRYRYFGFRVVLNLEPACPSADLTGDCFVDYEDFALMAAQWLTGDANIPDDMVYLPDGEFEMGDHFAEGYSDELPLHEVLLDSFFMSKFEINNRQYCDYLNSAEDGGEIKIEDGIVYTSSDGSNSYPYCDTSSSSPYSQIDYNNVSETFSVLTKGDRDMSNDPMVQVSWYGAAAYCNWRSSEEGYESCYNLFTWECDFIKKGYRLPTEAEWEYAARGGNPYYRFPWGDTISHSQANYYSYWEGGSPYYLYDVNPKEGYHPDWDDGIEPYTAPVGSFSPNGYGLYDMTGNLLEWCNDWYSSTYYGISPYDNPQGPVSGTDRVVRGGSWDNYAKSCRLANRGFSDFLIERNYIFGFRVVLDLN